MKKVLFFAIAFAASAGNFFAEENTLVEDSAVITETAQNSADAEVTPSGSAVESTEKKEEVKTVKTGYFKAAKNFVGGKLSSVATGFNNQLQNHPVRTLILWTVASVGIWEASKSAYNNYVQDEDQEFTFE